MDIIETGDGFDIVLEGRLALSHRAHRPCLFIGAGAARIEMNRGNFKLDDYVTERTPLASARVERDGEAAVISFAGPAAEAADLRILVSATPDSVLLTILAARPGANRFWIRLPAEPGERVWGAGEQMSYLNLRGRRFPLWTSEPGVGRDPTTRITFEAEKTGAGGNYATTNYPQPTYLTSNRIAVHVDTTAYAAFDFRHDDFHEIEVWEAPEAIEIIAASSLRALVSALSLRFGRQPELPDWVLEGAVIGLKDGERSFERLDLYRRAGAAVSALWCEDWAGVRQTSFGRRLFWDWRWSPDRYPDLPARIRSLKSEGVRFLGYVNPYLCVDGRLYPEAEERGLLALSPEGDGPYIVDFGEFLCGVVDFTNPEASDWFEEVVIGQNMLDLGLSGWMADFGEYLPHDVRLKSRLPGLLAHNLWPTLWAEVNARAVAKRGLTGEALFFMRAGWTGVQRACPMLWAGDQSVDFSRHDGLQTVICGALSSGLVGNAYHHSDIGGYTSLFGNVRTKELLMRWAEMAAFTPMMRTHEGNRPGDNLQVDQDPEVLAHFARMTRVFRHLSPYVRALSREAAATGLPLQRPLFLEFEDDPEGFDEQTSYLYGPDLLVAPVIEAGAGSRRLHLPAGAAWTHVWTGRAFEGGASIEVDAPFGAPPVFARKGSAFTPLFAALASL